MTLWCPEGAIYYPLQHLCVTTHYAIGPFSHAMQVACEQYKGTGSSECREENWDIYFAGVLRGVSQCPPGATFDTSLSACLDSEFAYGPFTTEQVEICRQLKWGFTCEIMRWPLAILQGNRAPQSPQPPIDTAKWNLPYAHLPKGKTAAALIGFYASADNYSRVYRQVMDWFGTTHNACVAFMSTALRNIGVYIPRELNQKGYNISTWTQAFSEYLEQNLGWQRIVRLTDLQPGDIVFTMDIDNTPGTPAHVFLFVDWNDSTETLARIVDNQGFLHTRELSSSTNSATPFQYGLRSP